MFCSHLHGENVLLELLDLAHVAPGDTQAQTQLDKTRHAESNAAHNFALLRQSLEDQLAQDSTALDRVEADRTMFATSLAAKNKEILQRLRKV